MSDEVEISRIDRGYGKFIVVKIAKWKENHYVDLREYYSDSQTQELKPTKKGIRFSYELMEEIEEAIGKVKEYMENPEP